MARLISSAGAAGNQRAAVPRLDSPDMAGTWAPAREPGDAYKVAVTSIGLLPNGLGAAAPTMLMPFGSGCRHRGPRKARA